MRNLVLVYFLFILSFTSCQTKAPTFGDLLATSLDQKLFKDFDSIAYFNAIKIELKNNYKKIFYE